MMTFKELKKLVKLPLYKEQRVPTVKALEESGVSVVAEKILENHGSISVYQNGYVIYRAHKRVTVFSLRNCVHYKYDALEGAGHHIEEEEFDEYEWHIRLVLEGEDRIFMNYEIIQGKWMPSREDREYREEILEGVDEAVSTLERMISEERVEELLSTLTDLQRKVVHINDIKDTCKEKGRNEECVFLVAGRMIYRKGLDFLFDALMRIPQGTRYQVRVVGDGPELEHLRKRCKDNLNLSEHVHCMGSIPYMEMEKEYVEEDENFGDFAPYDVSPERFLNLLRNAEYVCTDSFHGTAFSILNEKQFVVFNRYAENSSFSKNSRIDTLCVNFSLESRRYKNGMDLSGVVKDDIDYKAVGEKYKNLKQVTDEYLNTILREIKGRA